MVGIYTFLWLVISIIYPKIDWENRTTEGGSTETEEYKFIEAVRNSYMYQHGSQATRGRGMVSPSLLDLIMIREEGMMLWERTDRSGVGLLRPNTVAREVWMARRVDANCPIASHYILLHLRHNKREQFETPPVKKSPTHPHIRTLVNYLLV